MNESYGFSDHTRTDRGQGAQLPPPPKVSLEYYIIRATRSTDSGITKVSIHEINKFSTHDQAAANQTIANDMIQIISTFSGKGYGQCWMLN